MDKEKRCPILTIAKAMLSANRNIDTFEMAECLREHCRWWLGDAEKGDCSVNLIAGLTDETFQVSIV